MAAETTPTIDIASLFEGVLAGLFGATARLAPPTLVHPVLGNVETGLGGLWPARLESPGDGGDVAAPARLLDQRALRSFLIGAGEASERMGKLTLLGLAVSPLQQAWSSNGGTIGETSLQLVDDGSAEPGDAPVGTTRLDLTTSAVGALWKLDPLALDQDGAEFAAIYSDLMTAALAARAKSPDFQAASGAAPLEDLLEEGRRYLAGTATAWLDMVLGTVQLRADQQAQPQDGDHVARLNDILDAYNQNRSTPPASSFETYVRDTFLANHQCTRPLPEAEPSLTGAHFTDSLRSAIRHTSAGRPTSEAGGPDHAPSATTPSTTPSDPIVDSAIALAQRTLTYSTDPIERWQDDKADASSFVQRVLFDAGITSFDPGADRENVWSSLDLVTRDDVLVTVPAASAQPGDVLVQGGYRSVGGQVVWQGNCGIFTQKATSDPALLQGISMDRQGPMLHGIWGADPPQGTYDFGGNLIVRRVRPDEALIQAIAQRLVIEAGLGTDPDHYHLEARAASTLRAALQAQGTGGVLNPIAGVAMTPASLAANIRVALGLDRRAPITWENVVAVLGQILQDADVFYGFKALLLMSEHLTPTLGATDAEEDDPGIAALAEQLERDVLADVAGSLPVAAAALPFVLVPGMGKIYQPEQIRKALRAGRRFFSKILKPSTKELGDMVEQIIQADYALQHPNNLILMDFHVWGSKPGSWVPLTAVPGGIKIQQWLTMWGAQKKPDICDLTSREVFEIKPFRKVFLGLAQLYTNYLIPLNIGLYGFALAKSMLESLSATGKATISLPTGVKPFLPGTDFKSPRWYPLPGGSWAFVMRVAPGVIGYETVTQIGKEAYETVKEKNKRDVLIDAMAAMIAAAAAAAGARNVSGKPFTPDDLPDLFIPAPPNTPPGDARVLLAIAIGAVIVGILLADAASGGTATPVTLPILEGLIPAFAL